MARGIAYRYLWIGVVLAGVLGACGIFSGGSGPSFSSPPQAFPLTPNPISVQITLDKAHAITNRIRASAGVARLDELSGSTPAGVTFNFGIPEGLLTQAPDGTIDPAFGTPVTVTPVSAIGGIPFSKGYVTAFELDPEGLMMVDPATFEMTIPGEYNDLIGFASDGSGANFHLYPVLASSGGGTTSVTFQVMHFSMYGVAEATQAEIAAQTSHPPTNPGDQDDDLLAAPMTKSQLNLKKEHDRLVKPSIDSLDQLKGNCNDVVVGAYNFEHWYGHVQTAGQQSYFKDTVASDTNVLLERLKDCMKVTCPLCLSGKKADKATVNKLLVQAAFTESIEMLIGNTADANYYRALADKCAASANLPQPSPHVAECTGTDCGPTPTELACP